LFNFFTNLKIYSPFKSPFVAHTDDVTANFTKYVFHTHLFIVTILYGLHTHVSQKWKIFSHSINMRG